MRSPLHWPISEFDRGKRRGFIWGALVGLAAGALVTYLVS